jgi:hypothetical protein
VWYALSAVRFETGSEPLQNGEDYFVDHIHTTDCLFRSFKQAVWSIGLVFVLLGVGTAQETPIGPEWWPSEWGPDDQRGAANRITPQKVLSAAALITAGKIYQLGRQYDHGMPLLGKRV